MGYVPNTMSLIGRVSPLVRRPAGRACVLVALIGGGSLPISGCAPARATTPDAAVDRYVSALEAQDWASAYALLSEENRAELGLDEFKRLMIQNEREVREVLDQLRARSTPPYVTATVQTPAGEKLTLIYENGSWTIDESAIDLYSQKAPRIALGSFVRAYDHGRYDVLLRFVPERDLPGLSVATLKRAWEGEMKAEIEQVVEALRVSYQTAPLEILGEHATMSYGSGAAVELVLEAGSWKIENLQ